MPSGARVAVLTEAPRGGADRTRARPAADVAPLPRRRLVALPLPDALRTQVLGVEMSGAMLPVVVEIRSAADVDAALEVVRYRLHAR